MKKARKHAGFCPEEPPCDKQILSLRQTNPDCDKQTHLICHSGRPSNASAKVLGKDVSRTSDYALVCWDVLPGISCQSGKYHKK